MASSTSPSADFSANASPADASKAEMASAVSSIPQMMVDSANSLQREAAASPHGWVVKLMQREGQAILRMLWRLLGREADVMDAYQDCFCKLASLDNPRNLRSSKAYLYRTASNIAIEMLRVRKRRQAHWGRVVSSRPTETTDEQAEQAESGHIAALRAAIGRLPAHLRNVIMLRDFARMPYKEVGKTLGIDPATARVYRRHAVVKLAELLDQGESS